MIAHASIRQYRSKDERFALTCIKRMRRDRRTIPKMIRRPRSGDRRHSAIDSNVNANEPP
jgi:hypothetical protein